MLHRLARCRTGGTKVWRCGKHCTAVFRRFDQDRGLERSQSGERQAYNRHSYAQRLVAGPQTGMQKVMR